MGLLDGILGAGKLLSNFMGAGAGSSSSSSSAGSQSGKTVGSEQSVANTSETVNTTQRTDAASTGSRQEFSDRFLAELEAAALGGLGTSTAGRAAMTDELVRVAGSGFNPDAFVRDTVRAAEVGVRGQLESGINQTAMMTGGSTTGNSQAALLASRLRNEAEATIGGVRAQATATGQELSRNRSEQLAGITTSMDAGLATLINALKGGESSQTVKDTSVNTGTQQTSAVGTTQNNAVQQTNQQSTTKGKAGDNFNWAKAIGGIFSGIE